MMEQLTSALVSLSETMPVEWFTFVGSFVEEVIAPIPSPIVMTVAGSLAAAQGHSFLYLFVLSGIGAAGKTLGAIIVYGIAYVVGTVFVDRCGRFFGVTQADVDALNVRLGTGWKKLVSVTVLRALPIMSSAVVSVGCGVIRVALPTYFVATVIGTVVRDFFYLYVGFSGVAAYHALVDGLDSAEGLIQILIGLSVLLLLTWSFLRRKKTENS